MKYRYSKFQGFDVSSINLGELMDSMSDALLDSGYDDDYYRYYGNGCNGYRDGYYYGPEGRPYSRDGHPYYRRNGDCDDYYRNYGSYYGSPYCDRYDYQTGYCG